jgi:hypothetical protein
VTRILAIRPARPLLVLLLALAISGLAVALAPASHHGHDSVSAASRADRWALHDAMRQLWEDHIVWTRMAIIGIVDDRPDQTAAVNRLLENQDDIGDAIKPFYGEAAGAALSGLLREHILGAADLLVAAKTQVGFEEARTTWYANGAEIGAFLADANPRNWDRAEMQKMMADHLDLTLAEAVARLSADYDADVAAYDQIHVQILHMADMLTDGIVAQFPGLFPGQVGR